MLKKKREGRIFCQGLLYKKSAIAAFFGVSLIFTLFISYVFHQEHEERSREHFSDAVGDLKREIESRMAFYDKILKDGASIRESSRQLTQEAWEDSINRQELATDYPGLNEFGLIMLADGNRFIAMNPIPFGKVGDDVFASPIQRQAIERARDTGKSSLSKKTVLAEHPNIDAIMYYPIYQKSKRVATRDEKRNAFEGFLYAVLSMKAIFQGISGAEAQQLVYEIYDAKTASEKNLLYRSPGLDLGHTPKHETTATLKIGGETWSIHCLSTPAFETKIHYDVSLFVGLGGVVLDLMLLWALFSYAQKRNQLKIEHETLVKSENRLQTLLSSSTDGIHILGINGNLLEYSDAFIHMLGYSAEEAKHLKVYDWDDNFSETELAQMLSHVSKEPLTFETRHRRKNGTVFDVEITSKPIILDGEPCIFGSGRDISERKKRLEELAIFHSVIDDSSDMVFIIRIEDGYIEYANKTAEEMIGYTLEEMRMIGVEGFRRPIKGGQPFSDHLKALKEAGSLIDHAIVIRKDGSEFLAEADVHASLYHGTDYNIAIVRDISESEEYKKKIEKTSRSLKEAQQLAKLGSWQLDLMNNTLEWSDEVFEIFEIDKNDHDPSYEGFLNTVHPDDRELVDSAYQSSLENHTSYDYIHRLLMSDGSVKYVREYGEHVYDENNFPIESHGIVHDITENETYKKNLEKMNEHLNELVKEESAKIIEKEKLLMQQSKMAAMGEMVGMIAHQWRQPLNAVSAAAIKLNMLSEMGTLSPEQLQETSTFIQQMSQKMSRTINDFMDFAKPDRKKESVDIKHIIDGILKIIDAQLKTHNIALITKVQEGMTLHTYKHELSHVLMNFLSNARDAFDDKGIADKTITIRAYEEGDYAIIEIADNAGGIEPFIMDRIFDPFFTTKSTEKGTGIGLYMSKKMIEEDLKGVISASNKDGGALFKIEFPKIG